MALKRKVRIMCTFFVEVELDEEEYQRRHFIVEDNGCPGTGAVGAVLYKVMDETEEQGICWACKLGGSNVIVDSSDECRHVEMKT